jgi:hypothetical protein
MDVADDYPMLKALNITHVLMVLPMMSPPFPQSFKYLQIQIGDSPMSMIGRYFDEAIDFIDDALTNKGAILGVKICRSVWCFHFEFILCYQNVASKPFDFLAVLLYWVSIITLLMKLLMKLVHCARGASRSAAILCAYLMQKNNWDYPTASSYLKEKR